MSDEWFIAGGALLLALAASSPAPAREVPPERPPITPPQKPPPKEPPPQKPPNVPPELPPEKPPPEKVPPQKAPPFSPLKDNPVGAWPGVEHFQFDARTFPMSALSALAEIPYGGLPVSVAQAAEMSTKQYGPFFVRVPAHVFEGSTASVGTFRYIFRGMRWQPWTGGADIGRGPVVFRWSETGEGPETWKRLSPATGNDTAGPPPPKPKPKPKPHPPHLRPRGWGRWRGGYAEPIIVQEIQTIGEPEGWHYFDTWLENGPGNWKPIHIKGPVLASSREAAADFEASARLVRLVQPYPTPQQLTRWFEWARNADGSARGWVSRGLAVSWALR